MNWVCLLLLLLTGCSRSTPVIQDFRARIAAVKACTTGSTIIEFRAARQQLVACFEAHRPLLESQVPEWQEFSRTLSACEQCWDFSNRYPEEAVSDHPDYPDVWPAVVFLNPAIRQRPFNRNDPAFYPAAYIAPALHRIATQCDALLSERLRPD